MLNVTCVVGTRPEAIKMAPVVMKLRESEDFAVSLLSTGQHAAMLDQALRHFGLVPDFNLNVMKERQSLDHITTRVLEGTGAFLDERGPDMLLVHGDTTTTLSAALAAFYRKIPVAHVEAGLRSYDMAQPFPEEANRVMTDRLSELCFAPTDAARDNLLKEGIAGARVFVTGNTVIDALQWTASRAPRADTIFEPDARVVLVTAHRRESWGEPLVRIVSALGELLRKYRDLHAVIPLHLNPEVREVFYDTLEGNGRAHYMEPLDYPEFIGMMRRSTFIMSDSGGIQEEATALRKPLLILRELSERPEAVSGGTGTIVGSDTRRIVSAASRLLDDREYLESFAGRTDNPFGDGKAAGRIVKIVREYLENRLPWGSAPVPAQGA